MANTRSASESTDAVGHRNMTNVHSHIIFIIVMLKKAEYKFSGFFDE